MVDVASVAGLRWGLAIPFVGVPLADHEPLVRLAERLGYDDLWSAEATGHDGFTPLALAAAWTERLRLGTGVVNPYTRGPALLAQTTAAIADASGGRFVLGLGSSSDRIVQQFNGIPFVKPLTRVREAIAELRCLLDGGRSARGFRLETPPAQPVPIHVAALRPRMLRTAGELGDGAILTLAPLSGLAQMIEQIRLGERAAGRPQGSVEIVCRTVNVPLPPDEGIELVKFLFAAYAAVPVYTNFFRWLGWGERIDPMVQAWEAGDRARALALVPADLVREIYVFGDLDAQRDRMAELAQCGVTSFCLSPVGAPDQIAALLEAFASAFVTGPRAIAPRDRD